MNKLLIDDYPIQVLPKLAVEVGLNEAIFLQQLHYWLSGKSAKNVDGNKWIYNTYEDWQKQFPFWSISTVKRTITSLDKQNLLLKGNYNKLGFDKTVWYSVDYAELNRVNQRLGQNEPTSGSKRTNGEGQNEPTNTIDYTETTSESKEYSLDLKEKKEKKKKEVKHKYGEFKNVLLSEDEYIKLTERFPNDLKSRIERLSGYVASTGKSYKSHYATIINWARKDNSEASNKKEISIKDRLKELS